MENGAFLVRRSPDVVEGWATRRLPFEPRGWQLEYRDALRIALARLEPSVGGCLTATYTAEDAARCDVENVLLYNVGHGAFSHLPLQRIRLRRQIGVPAEPTEPLGPGLHHHRYAVSHEPPGREAARLIAVAHDVPLSMPLKVESVWLQASRRLSTARELLSPDRPLQLTVDIHRPERSSRPTLMALTKGVIDGFMAAVSAHDGRDMATISARLTDRLGVRLSDIVVALQPSSPAPLGVRRLLWPFGSFVQWNPADDRLDRIDLRVSKGVTWSADCWLHQL